MHLFLGIGFTLVSGFKDDTGSQGSKNTTNSQTNCATLEHADDEMDAAYVGMVFLNALFAGGRGIVIFAVFGLEYDTVTKPLIKWGKTVQSLYRKPPSEKEDDSRLYHWTLRLVSKIFQLFPNNRRLISQMESNASVITIINNNVILKQL